jgi:putative transposase
VSYPTATRQAVLRDLQTVHDHRGSVPAALVRECAEDVGCASSTIWGWWRAHREGLGHDTTPRPAGRLSEVQIEVIVSVDANISEAHRRLTADPETRDATPPRRTLAWWWANEEATLRAYTVGGGEALVNKQMRVRHQVEERNVLWRTDHQQFPVWVLPNGRSSRPVKPWVTTIVDDATRYVMAVLVTVEEPTATTVGVALADAARTKPTTDPNVVVGGLPVSLGSDNGGEFRSGQYKTMLRRLDISPRHTFPYLKHINGKAERVQQTMQHELGKVLPGYADGPKTLRMKELFCLAEDLLSEELFTELVLDWVNTYNTERPHQALDGDTPLQAWAAQDTPLRHAEPEALRLAMMPTAARRKVTPDGISFQSELYTSGELAALRLVDRQVDVRYLPHDDSFIEVFDGERWLCTAVRANQVDEQGRLLMREVNREQYLRARDFHVAARHRRRRAAELATVDNPKLGSLTAPQPESLLEGGDDLLLELSDARQAGAPVESTTRVVEVELSATDPWELPATNGHDSADGHDTDLDLEGSAP